MTLANPVPYPIYLADEAEGPVPSKYISIKRTQACQCCDLVHEYCELYAYSEMRTSLGMGKRVENLRRVTWPRYNLPIEQWEDNKVVLLPWCHDCLEPSLQMTPGCVEPPPPQRVTLNWLSGTDPKVEKGPPRASNKTVVRVVKPQERSVDELWNMVK